MCRAGNAEQVQSQTVPSRPHIPWPTAPSRTSLSSLKFASRHPSFPPSTLTFPLQVELGESIAARTESLCQYRRRTHLQKPLTTPISSSFLSRARPSGPVSCCKDDRSKWSTRCKSIRPSPLHPRTISITALLIRTDWILSLRVRRRRIFISLSRGLYQLLDLLVRRHLRLVLQRVNMESSERVLLVRIPQLLLLPTAAHTLSFSCFNAFSRVDVRVDVKIPGGVHAYVIDLRGERRVLLLAGAVEC